MVATIARVQAVPGMTMKVVVEVMVISLATLQETAVKLNLRNGGGGQSTPKKATIVALATVSCERGVATTCHANYCNEPKSQYQVADRQ